MPSICGLQYHLVWRCVRAVACPARETWCKVEHPRNRVPHNCWRCVASQGSGSYIFAKQKWASAMQVSTLWQCGVEFRRKRGSIPRYAMCLSWTWSAIEVERCARESWCLSQRFVGWLIRIAILLCRKSTRLAEFSQHLRLNPILHRPTSAKVRIHSKLRYAYMCTRAAHNQLSVWGAVYRQPRVIHAQANGSFDVAYLLA